MTDNLNTRMRVSLGVVMTIALIAGSAISTIAQERNNRAPDGQKYVTVLGIQSATVAPSGLIFGAGSSSFEIGGANAPTGGVGVFGFGFGDAEQSIGGQATLSVFGANGGNSAYRYLGLKAAHRLDTPDPTYVALALDRLAPTGPISGDDPAATLVLTRFSNYLAEPGGDAFPVMMSLGVGSQVSDQGSSPGVFFGAGIGVTRNLGVSAAWNGSDVDLGAAFRFEELENAGFSVLLTDALDQNDRQGISLGVSLFFDTGFGR